MSAVKENTLPPVPTLDDVLTAYAHLERRIESLLPPALGRACAECGGKCCRAGIANQTIRSWFLREVSRRAYGQWWPPDWEQRGGCVALTPTGCLLGVGRPIICRSYVDEPYLSGCRDPWEVLFCALLSELLPHAVRLTGRLHLLDLDEPGAAANAPLIAARLAEAGRFLDAGQRLIAPDADEAGKSRIALGLVCSIPLLLQEAVREAVLARLPSWLPR